MTASETEGHAAATPQAPLDVIVITGMSGAGRTASAKVLEDLEYFVIDNLPPQLLGRVVDLAGQAGAAANRFAVVTDVRSREFFGDLVHEIDRLRAAGSQVRMFFLDASDDVLLRRFREARRVHPADDQGAGVQAGIARERELLAELRGQADLRIDTSETSVHDLRDTLTQAVAGDDAPTMAISVVSFGFKHGTPKDADMLMDVRFLPNPHWDDALRPFTGRDQPVRDFVLQHPVTRQFLDRYLALLDAVVPGYQEEGKRYLTIGIGCTGGRHRSVAIAEEVARHLRDSTELPVRVRHNDLRDHG